MTMILLSLIPFILFIGVIFLVEKISTISGRLTALEREINALRALDRRLQALEQPADIAHAARVHDESPITHIAAPKAVREQLSPASPPTPSRTREEWEQIIGGKVLNRIGALALIIGLGSFLKYAFDNNWISETMRVAIGASIGIASLAGGYRTNKRGFEIFAQGLVGAGISILYLAVYASFNFYSLVPQWAAFALMSLVTVIAFTNALYYNSQAEALLGLAGGFLTPVLLSTGTANETGLFTYLLLLDAGLIALMLRKESWLALEPLTLAATWLIYQQWFASDYTPAALMPTLCFATLFWAAFLVLDIARTRSARAADPAYQIVPGLNAAIYFLALYFLLDKYYHAWMGPLTLALGVIYLFILIDRTRHGGLHEHVKTRYGLTALALAVIATAIRFAEFDMVMMWSVEATALMWCSRRWKLEYVEISAIALFALAGFTLCFLIDTTFAYAPIGTFIPVLNRRAAAFIVLAAALWGSAALIGTPRTSRERSFVTALQYGWMMALFLLLTAETHDFFRRDIEALRGMNTLAVSHEPLLRLNNLQQMTLSGIWLLYCAVLMSAGLAIRNREMRLAAIILFGASILKIFVYDLSFLETLYRIFSFVALGLVLLAVSYAYQKYKHVILEKNISA